MDDMKSLHPSIEIVENYQPETIRVASDALYATLKTLHDDPRFDFAMLKTHTGVDFIERGQIELVYVLYSLTYDRHLNVVTNIPRDPAGVVPTVCDLWQIAEWLEREVYDMFGVLYDNHPDLRRILLDDDWVGHPLRKDYKDDYMLEPPTWQ